MEKMETHHYKWRISWEDQKNPQNIGFEWENSSNYWDIPFEIWVFMGVLLTLGLDYEYKDGNIMGIIIWIHMMMAYLKYHLVII